MWWHNFCLLHLCVTLMIDLICQRIFFTHSDIIQPSDNWFNLQNGYKIWWNISTECGGNHLSMIRLRHIINNSDDFKEFIKSHFWEFERLHGWVTEIWSINIVWKRSWLSNSLDKLCFTQYIDLILGEITTSSLSDEQITSLVNYIGQRLPPESQSKGENDWPLEQEVKSKAEDDWTVSRPMENKFVGTEDMMGNWGGVLLLCSLLFLKLDFCFVC